MTQKKRPEAETVQSAEAQPVEVQSVPSHREPKKKKKGYVKYSPLSLILLSVCAFVFSFSLLGLFEQSILDAAAGFEVESLAEGLFDPIGNENGDENVISPGPDSPVRHWQHIAVEEIDTDALPYLQTLGFEALQEQNEDTVAWMYWPTTTDVKGLPFNMAVVQSEDNEFYLSRSFDKSSNSNGWIYSDYRCKMGDILSNRNTIIYGHARSYLMFGGLRYLNTKSKWQEDGYNHFIYINTPTERTVWQVFAWYETTTEFNYINTDFSNDTEYLEFLNTVQSKNTIEAFESFNFTPEDRILTLSTCKGSNSNVRIAMHAVLVKYQYIGEGVVSPDGETDSATDSVADTITDIVTDAVTDSVTDSVVDTVTDSVADTVTGSVTDSVTDTITDIVTDSATDLTTDSVVDTVTDPVTDSITDSVTDTITDIVTDSATGSVTDTITDTVTDSATDSVTDSIVDAVTDSVTDPVTDTITDTVTDSATDSITDSATDSITDSVADIVTRMPLPSFPTTQNSDGLLFPGLERPSFR